MYGLKEMLLQEHKHLESIIAKLNENEIDNAAPEGKLRISVNKGTARYYQCKEDKFGEYIPRENMELPRLLAQKTYNETVLKTTRKRAKLIAKCLKDYSDDEIEKLYTSLHLERQKLITPVEPIVSQLEEKWYLEQYVGKPFRDGSPVILTEKGERVRSKSEKILADYFFRNNILYKYEKPLMLEGSRIIYPDFTFFSKKLKKEIYWEHEGMMDKSEYAINAVKKLNTYQLNGIMLGERLILTFETEQDVLNSTLVSDLVEKYLR